MAFNYEKYVDIISDKIDEYGGTIYYRKRIDGSVNSLTDVTTYNTIQVPLKALVAPYSTTLIDGVNIKNTDKQVFIKSTLGKPKLDDNLEIGEQIYKVLEIKDYAPGVDDTLVYVIKARSYEVAKPIDIFKVLLSSLAPGSIIKDIDTLYDSPDWMVLAQGHHDANTTTLLCDKVFELYSFDGSYEGAAYAPDTPWYASNMRKRLTDYWIPNYISTKLQAWLLTMEIETQTNVSNDKITLLSKEEVYNVQQGSSSGSYIDYFDSDLKRVGLWYDNDSPVEYWTRDVYSWSAPTGTISTVDGDGSTAINADYQRRGVRPMIFLTDTLEVILDEDGKYSLDY